MNFITAFLFYFAQAFVCFKLLFLFISCQPLSHSACTVWEAELVKVVRQMAIASFTITIPYACTVGTVIKKDDENEKC